MYPAAQAVVWLLKAEVHVSVELAAAFVIATQAVPAHVVAPSTQTSEWVAASPSSQLWPPQPAVVWQEAWPGL